MLRLRPFTPGRPAPGGPRPRRAPSLLASLLCAFTLAGCAQDGADEGARDAAGTEITVAAAANLTEVFGELTKTFTERTGVRVVTSFGATADLAKQIENGAPFDAFASADVAHVAELERRGFIAEGTRALYARGRLVVWTPPGARAGVARLEDLAREEVTQVALARPELAPYGQAAVDALRAVNVWEQVEPKAVYAQNVAQARQFAASGNADAAFLPRALVREGEGAALEVEESLHRPLEQAAGVVKASAKQEAARRFVRFLTGDEAQKIFERYGYRRPGG